MFTGIIKNKAEFVSLKKDKSKYFLTLSTVQKFTNKDIGSSISINGICLTLIRAKLIKNSKIRAKLKKFIMLRNRDKKIIFHSLDEE